VYVYFRCFSDVLVSQLLSIDHLWFLYFSHIFVGAYLQQALNDRLVYVADSSDSGRLTFLKKKKKACS